MRRFICFLLLSLATAVACNSQPAPPPTLPTDASPALLQFGVTSGASPIAALATEVYAQHTSEVQLQFVVANSTTLYNDLANGLLDAILVHHIPENNGRYFNPVALDGLVIITHPDNPVQALTSAEVQAIFSGRLTNWQAVGGVDQPIVLLSREPGSGLRTLLRQRLMAEQRISPNALLQSGNEIMLTAVADNPAAISYSSMSSASQTPTVQMVQLDGRAATTLTTADQTYPLTTPLYFVAATEAEPIGELRAFLAWLQSAEGQAQLGLVYGRIR